ncbi:M15 family metallopeptidase [Brevibacterium casei]
MMTRPAPAPSSLNSAGSVRAGRSPVRGVGRTAALLALAAAALVGIVGCSPNSSPVPTEDRAEATVSVTESGLDLDNGALPADARIDDGDLPGVAKLDANLRKAVAAAAADAREDGVDFTVNSGWRSASYQKGLLDDAVATYGSRTEAARWVASPESSPHVRGKAVDIGPVDASSWLSQHGADYGLCQIYGNEMWHYELRTDAAEQGCPAQYSDPTEDPRMRG